MATSRATSRAAWLSNVGDKLSVKEMPYTSPKENELVIKAHAWAVNPIDIKLQEVAMFPWLKYPLILGFDLAGEVVDVGTNVTSRFKKGDRVLSMPSGGLINNHAGGGFQEYVVVEAVITAPIPEHMSYTDASVLPLCLSTAASGLFQDDFLALPYPTVPGRPVNGEAIVVWGGSSSVGCNVIQLAKAAGYNVIATASPKNFDYLKSLGASEVFDYNSPNVIDDLVATVTGGKKIAGMFAAAGSVDPSIEVAGKIHKATGSKVFVASAIGDPKDPLPEGVKSKMIFGSTLKDNAVGPVVWTDFLPEALRSGAYRAAPEPWVVTSKGVEGVQEAIEIARQGVSARKVVVSAAAAAA